MVKETEVNEICKVYERIDDMGKKKMILMSKKFFDIQKIMDNEKVSLVKCENVEFKD
jgi:hypothetical protein